MCGIAGFVGQGNREDLDRMIDSIRYRGPDDKGVFFIPGVGLAHARLSIIDLTPTGHQPMASRDDRFQIVFNGEIYNFKDLKKLVSGYPFKSNSDTEVILALFEKFGTDCFEKLDGMFALAIYDSHSGTLVLARDRIGKKPLYWSQHGDTLIFGSELRALMAHPLLRKEIDPVALSKYLFYEYIPTPATIFKNVSKLKPASYAIFKDGNLKLEKYWRPNYNETRESFDDSMVVLDAALANAVKKRLISDVPLGIFLSGGIDSSAISYYAQRDNIKKIKTFSIGFNEKSFDESSYARKVSDFLGTEHYEATVSSKEIIDLIPTFADIIDEPMADPSLVPTYLLSKFTRTGVTVALGGDGGDELFSGYPMFQADPVARIYEKIPAFVRKGIIEPLIHSLPVGYDNLSLDFKLKRFIGGFDVPSRYRHHTWQASFNVDQQANLFSESFKNGLANGNIFDVLDRYAIESGTDNPARQLDYLYLRTYLMDDILVKVDRASMKEALEVRAPFLDRDVVDLVNTFPTSFKQRGFTTKYILKKLMSDKLPKDIVNRRKKGFGIPLAGWLKNDLKTICNDVLSRDSITAGGIFNWDYIQKLKNQHFSGKANNYKQLWTLMVFQMWLNRWGK
jgi:asparagine synthase (glutamine-hydrolysing)